MALRKSVYLSTATAEWVNSTTEKDETGQPKWSEALNASVASLRHILKSSLPIFTASEWNDLIEAYPDPDLRGPIRIAVDLMDKFGAVDVTDLTCYAQNLVRRTRMMSQAEQMAILYAIKIYRVYGLDNSIDIIETVNRIKADYL
jgi:hypothetical protein